MAIEFSHCPDCGKKGVRYWGRPHGEDFMGCRYCEFYFYTLSRAPVDVANDARWIEKNPGQQSYYAST